MSRVRQGTALVVVMVVVVMLALAAYGFLHIMQTEYRSAAFSYEYAESRSACLSGQDYVLAWLQQSRAQRQESLLLGGGEDRFAGIALEAVLETDGPRGWSFSVVSPEVSAAAPGPWRFGLQNESAKLNLRMLEVWEKEQPGQALAALMLLPGITEDQASELLLSLGIAQSSPPENSAGDSSDDAPGVWPASREFAASGVSATRTSSVSLATGMPRTLAELVGRGVVTESQMWGKDRDRNYVEDDFATGIASPPRTSTSLDFALPSDAMPDAAAALPWSQFLTLDSAERNQRWDGQPRIWVNQSELTKLEQELLQSWPADWVNFVIAYRQYGPASETPSTSSATATVTGSQWNADLSVPAAVEITSILDLIGVSVIVPLPEGGQGALESPFVDEPTQYADYIHLLLDDVTLAQVESQPGRINLLEAPPEVLAAVPGIDVALAQSIIERRGQSDAGGEQIRSIGWLLSEQVVDLTTMKRISPYLTTGGDVYRGQVIGFRDELSSVYRLTAAFSALDQANAFDVQTWHAWGRGFREAELREGPQVQAALSENPLP